MLGLGFKEGTDDLRESPVVELVERLLGKGYELQDSRPHVSLASLMGANRDYILNRIPHIARLLVDNRWTTCSTMPKSSCSATGEPSSRPARHALTAAARR